MKQHVSSITDIIYTEIIKKSCAKQGINEESITNGLKNLSKAVKIAANTLISLKSTEKSVIKQLKLKELITNAVDLTKVYIEGKNIDYIVQNNAEIKIPVDETKFTAAIINLVKNASEAFNAEDVRNDKYIKVETEEDGDFGVIRISNNAGKIIEPEKIFKDGYTTKSTGSGLGLRICKKSIEEMYGKFDLEHNDNDYVEFTIRIAKVG